MMYKRPLEKDFNSIIELFTGPLMVYFIIIFAITFVFALIILIGKIKLFIKCGQKWWKAFIPFYGTYTFIVKIAGLHWAFFILTELMFFDLFSIVLYIIIYAMVYYNLAKKCHQDTIASAIFGAIFSGIVSSIYGYNSNIEYDFNTKVNKCSFFENIIK